jgi:hypothetical protein
MIGMHVELVEMCAARLEYLYVREPNGNIVRDRDPQVSKALGSPEHRQIRGLGQDRFWRMSDK